MSFSGKIIALALGFIFVMGAWYVISSSKDDVSNQSSQTRPLDYDTLIAYYFSHRPDLAGLQLGYDYAIYDDCRAAMEAPDKDTVQRRAAYQEAFENWVKSLPRDARLPARATVQMTGTFGQYDEATQILYFDPLDVDTIVRIKKERGRIVHTCHPPSPSVWPEEFHVRFTNGDAIYGIPMPRSIASRLETDKGRKVEITMTIVPEAMDTHATTVLKATPTVTATIVDMHVVHVDRLGNKLRDLVTFDEAAVEAMNAALDERLNGARMAPNGETFARWADHLDEKAGLVAKHGYAVAAETPLRSILFDVPRADLDYPRSIGAVPRDLRAEGTVYVRPVWLRIGTTPKEMTFETEIGTVALQFANQWDFDGKFHTVNVDLLQLLLRAEVGVEWQAKMVFTPQVYFTDTRDGRPRHVFRGRIERMDYTARPVMQQETATTVFTEQTLVRKKHLP